jgi:hypothetical protein
MTPSPTFLASVRRWARRTVFAVRTPSDAAPRKGGPGKEFDRVQGVWSAWR